MNDMNASSGSLSTAEHMAAPEYQAASWAAYERKAPPPDPGPLSDRALYAFLHYEGPELLLPSAARNAVEAESMRRGASPVFVDQVTGFAMMAALPVAGMVIGLGLLIP
jgi:hypothetical protein